MTVHTVSRIAAEWWAKQLNPSTKSNLTTLGDDMPSDKVDVIAIALMLNEQVEGDAEKFTDALAAYIDMTLDNQAMLHLKVDYHPDEMLKSALKAGGFDADSLDVLPWKTQMYVYLGKIEVSLQYGGWQTVYEYKWEERK